MKDLECIYQESNKSEQIEIIETLGQIIESSNQTQTLLDKMSLEQRILTANN